MKKMRKLVRFMMYNKFKSETFLIFFKKRIESTIYLGCKMINNKLEAHAWLRCGEIYITGGDGKDFTQVVKFSL